MSLFLPVGSRLIPPRTLPGEACFIPRTPTRPAQTTTSQRSRLTPRSLRSATEPIAPLLRGSAALRDTGALRALSVEAPRTPRTPRETGAGERRRRRSTPTNELIQAPDPFPHGRPGIVPIPALDARARRLAREQLAQPLGARGVGPAVAGRPAAQDVQEALHVAPEPAHDDAGGVTLGVRLGAA